MADTKWSQFPSGGATVPSDTLVGLRAGANVQLDANTLLRSTSNLSDVSNTDTARTNLSAPKSSSGVGSPQGVVAGDLGDLYIDTSAPTDKFYVCVVAGTAVTATWQLQTNISGALLIANNLSDVANPVTSLSNIGGQPVTIVGSGDPNGNQAGTAGISLYFDTAGVQLWICTQTGTSSTAVWAIQNQQGGGIDTVNLSFTTTQMTSNKLYVGIVASPSPAIGIMPISPSDGDLLIIYSAATAGVTIQKGTAAIINVTNNLVTSDLFVPFRNTLVLRCYNSGSGGQWFSESIDDTVIIDGTTTVGYQPVTIVGSGNPNGNQPGVAGINLYFDTSIAQSWICIQTGTSSTAVWRIQNETGLQTISLTLTTPIQMLTNKQYIGSLSFPSPAIGIMPIAPTAGDILVVYSPASQGTTVQIGTAAQIEISGNLVVSSFFIPQRSSIVLRCFNASSGGQWYAEAIDGPIIVDGTITVDSQPINLTGSGNPNGSFSGRRGINFYYDIVTSDLWDCVATGNSSTAVWNRLVTQNNAFTDHRFYFSSIKGSDTSGNGSEEFPFASYAKAASEAFAVATSSSQAVVFAMGNESISGGMTIYPFVNIAGYSTFSSSITCTGVISLDASFNSTANASCIINNVSISAAGGVNLIFTTSQNQLFVFYNSPIINTPTVNVQGSAGANNEVIVFYNDVILPPNTSSAYTLKNVVSTFDGWFATSVSMVNDAGTNQSILILSDNAIVDEIGDITISSFSPNPGVILFSQNSFLNSLTIDGDASTAILDVVSYTSSLTFTGGASFSSIFNANVSDGLSARNFTPVNYTPTGNPSLYDATSVTGHLNGIDNQLGVIESPPILAASNHGLPNIVLAGGGSTFLTFTVVAIDTASAYNNTTCEYTIPKTGKYDINYQVRTTATGTVSNNNYFIDTAIIIDGLLNTSDEYCSNDRTDLALGVTYHTTNTGGAIIQLNQNQIVKVSVVNNGNISTTILNGNFRINYLGP